MPPTKRFNSQRPQTKRRITRRRLRRTTWIDLIADHNSSRTHIKGRTVQGETLVTTGPRLTNGDESIQAQVPRGHASNNLTSPSDACRTPPINETNVDIHAPGVIGFGHQRLSYYHGRRIAALQVPNTDPDRMRNVRSACEQLTMFVTHPSIMVMRKSIDSLSKCSKTMLRRPVPETRGRLLPPVWRLHNRHHKLLGVRWYFGEFPPQPTLVRERLELRGYMVDRLRELMLLGQLSPVQKIELSMVLYTVYCIVVNM